jgi:hypothetical protein
MRALNTSYILCAAGLFGFAGLHRFYLNKPVSGILYLCTWGFFGFGTFFDLLRMPELVDSYNYKILRHGSLESGPRFSNPERQILLAANKHHGLITPQMVTMATGLSLRQAKEELEKMRKEEYCSLDIAEDGSELYQFHGLKLG